MTTFNRIGGIVPGPAGTVRKAAGWFLAFGIIQIAVGVLAVSFAFSATLASMFTLGILFLIAAAAQFAATVFVWPFNRSLLFFLIGVLYGVAGCLTLRHPVLIAQGLTLMLAGAFLIGGIFRIVAAIVEDPPGAGWLVISGFITVVLGILIWQQWPSSGLWVLGMFVGIDLIFNGVIWAVLAGIVRRGLAPLVAQ